MPMRSSRPGSGSRRPRPTRGARGAAETPGEFTTRILGERPAAAADLTRLLGIYERVRFGGHEADAAEREAARDALVRIREAWT